MDFLIVAPPVCTPAEPPSGAFTLAAALTGRGFETGLLDLSLELYHSVFARLDRSPRTKKAFAYLQNTDGGYLPPAHRTHVGVLHSVLRKFATIHPGWKLTLMDVYPPCRIHAPQALARMLAARPSPFRPLYETVLTKALQTYRPRRVLVSLAYLSQLAATIDLVAFLTDRGIRPLVGGSLVRSLAQTGHGLDALRTVIPDVCTDDGSALCAQPAGAVLNRLAWPRLLSAQPYLSARPIIPLPLSVGCFWHRCLFCPDRVMKFRPLKIDTLNRFFCSVPSAVLNRRPVVHLIDSALPPQSLRRFFPLAKAYGIGFYGFARPTAALCKDALLEQAARAGCLMLQLGLESGSRSLLERFEKGIDPQIVARVLRRSAAAGIRNYVYLMFGLPGETDQARTATLKFMEKNQAAVDFLNLSLFNLPRYCELTRRAAEFDIRIQDFPHQPPFAPTPRTSRSARDEALGIRLYHPFTCPNGAHREHSPRAAARRFIQRRFIKDPAVRPAYLRTPRWFRAAHLALMRVSGRNDGNEV
jgi:hypothetical protein